MIYSSNYGWSSERQGCEEEGHRWLLGNMQGSSSRTAESVSRLHNWKQALQNQKEAVRSGQACKSRSTPSYGSAWLRPLQPSMLRPCDPSIRQKKIISHLSCVSRKSVRFATNESLIAFIVSKIWHVCEFLYVVPTFFNVWTAELEK